MFKSLRDMLANEGDQSAQRERILAHTLSRPLTDSEMEEVSGACCSTGGGNPETCDDVAQP